jgi:hypothetical protein
VEEIPDSYKEFQRLRLPILHPLDPPISLPVLPKDIDPGRFFFSFAAFTSPAFKISEILSQSSGFMV